MWEFIKSLHWYHWTLAFGALLALGNLLVLFFSRAYWMDGSGGPFLSGIVLILVSVFCIPRDPALVAQEQAAARAKLIPHEIAHDSAGCVTMEFYKDTVNPPIRYTRCPNSTVTTESQHSHSCGKGCTKSVQDYTFTKD